MPKNISTRSFDALWGLSVVGILRQLPVNVAAVWPLLLLFATLFLLEIRLWNFSTSSFSVVGKIAPVTTVFIGHNTNVYHCDVSESIDETYGGLQGIGGLEAIITPTKTYSIVHDTLGHVVATYDGTETKRAPTQVGSYGPLPGSLALSLTAERGLHETTHWLGKRLDETGLIWLGARYYNPDDGRFISADPLGHQGSLDLYSFARNDAVNFTDPDGRFGKAAFQGATKGDYFTPANNAQAWGKEVGQFVAGLVPYYGQAGDVRDLTAAVNVGRTEGWNLRTGVGVAMAGVAFVPGVGDAIRSGVKPLFKTTPTSAVAKGPAQAFEVGTANDLIARSVRGDKLEVHHVGQAHPLEQVVPGYNRAAAPAIVVPRAQHITIPTVRGPYTGTARDQLAKDIWDLRTYTEAPNSSLRQVIELNKQMYPGAYIKP